MSEHDAPLTAGNKAPSSDEPSFRSVMTFTLGICWLCLFCDYASHDCHSHLPELEEAVHNDFLTSALLGQGRDADYLFADHVLLRRPMDARITDGRNGCGGRCVRYLHAHPRLPYVAAGARDAGVARPRSSPPASPTCKILRRRPEKGCRDGCSDHGDYYGVMLGPPVGGLLYSLWEPLPFSSFLRCGLSASGVLASRRESRGGRPWRVRAAGNQAEAAARCDPRRCPAAGATGEHQAISLTDLGIDVVDLAGRAPPAAFSRRCAAGTEARGPVIPVGHASSRLVDSSAATAAVDPASCADLSATATSARRWGALRGQCLEPPSATFSKRTWA